MNGAELTKERSPVARLAQGGYRDFVLAAGVVIIVSLMIFPLPLLLLDTLIAINILISVSLVLMGIYIPSPVSFSSFPSVILLSTLFRLSLSIATTRLILLNADAGNIIDTFGRLVVGGNLVVGLVIFIIITVVQFVVIAKGAERVAEVAARFTLDAMPGKQLSIDSDLRSGLIDKEEAKRKRRNLEVESQLHGSLDGAMKFVKGDAIAGIVIVIINILGGLTIGMMQRDMSFADAMATYSILTIGDGLVAQIPALLTSIAAGLIITRSEGDNDSHLGDAIAEQLTSHSRVILIAAVISGVLTLVPGFPWLVFLVLAVALFALYLYQTRPTFLGGLFSGSDLENSGTGTANTDKQEIRPVIAAALWLHPSAKNKLPLNQLTEILVTVFSEVKHYYGVPLPIPEIVITEAINENHCQLMFYETCVMQMAISDVSNDSHEVPLESEGVAVPGNSQQAGDQAVAGNIRPVGVLPKELMMLCDAQQSSHKVVNSIAMKVIEALTKNLGMFLGIQETSNLVTLWNRDYPELIKESLRVIVPQHLSEVLRRLLNEGVSIRNLRTILEALTEAGGREKDLGLLTEFVRVSMKKQLTQQFCGSDKRLKAIMLHPEFDDEIQQVIRNSGGNQVSLEPDRYKTLIGNLQGILEADSSANKAIVCSMEVRRHLRRLLAEEFYHLPVISYLELTDDVRVEPVAQLTIA